VNLQEVDEDSFKSIPSNVNKVESPLQSLKYDWDGISVEESRNIDKQVIHSHTLRTRLICKTLYWVKCLQRGEGKRECDPKDVDECNSGPGTRRGYVCVGELAFTAVEGGECDDDCPPEDEERGTD